MTLPPTIPHLAQAAAALWGDAPALLDAGECWSYAELWHQAQRAAASFLHAGIIKGDRVAIWAPNSREWIVAAIGAQTAGAAIVPLNTRLKGQEAGDILRRTGSRMLLTVGDFLGTDYPALLKDQQLPALQTIMCFDHDWHAFLANAPAPSESSISKALATLAAEDVSDIMFTSGTTGVPKGVLTTHSRIIPMFKNWTELVDLRPGDRYLIVNPFFHSFGLKAGWVAALIAGAVIVPMAVFDVGRMIDHIEQDRIAFIPGPPTIYQALLVERATRPFDTSSLRSAMTGAATVPPVLIERMHSELGFKQVLTAYGMTECSNITACRPGDSVDLIANSCGRAIPGMEVKCVTDDGHDAAPGETGEVWARGYGVMLGYLDDPAATSDAIDAEGWLHTGDVGVMDENGYLRITDRKKDMYISGGFNCYPAEIEKLLSAHPAIGQVAVIGVHDERMGEVGKAFIILRPGAAATESEIIAWSRDAMANYKLPRHIAFVESLPLNASGKVLKTELRG